MANFNLADYETVEQRIKRFYTDFPDGRIITENLTTPADRSVSTWVVKAYVFLSVAEQDLNTPKATGFAFEVDGAGMANKTSALENAETSAIGRALANAGYSGNKRTSREEMEKVARDVTPQPIRDFVEEAKGKNIEQLRKLYADAVKANAAPAVLARLTELATNG